MVINQIALRSPGGVQRGPAPSGGGLGVSPRLLKTPLGREGGKNNAHVAATTPTPPPRTGRRIDIRPAPARNVGLPRCAFCEQAV